MTETLRPVLVVDDDSNFRTLVTELLERAGFSTIEAGTGSEALALAVERRPILVVLDVVLPESNGYAVCNELRLKLGNRLPIMFVSGERCYPFDRVAGLLIGADDYLVKPFDPDEFVARVTRMIERVSPREPAGAESSVQYKLTAREAEVLTLLVEGLNQASIAERLYVSPKTVGTHIQRILGKLGVSSRAQAVSLALRERLVEMSV